MPPSGKKTPLRSARPRRSAAPLPASLPPLSLVSVSDPPSNQFPSLYSQGSGCSHVTLICQRDWCGNHMPMIRRRPAELRVAKKSPLRRTGLQRLEARRDLPRRLHFQRRHFPTSYSFISTVRFSRTFKQATERKGKVQAPRRHSLKQCNNSHTYPPNMLAGPKLLLLGSTEQWFNKARPTHLYQNTSLLNDNPGKNHPACIKVCSFRQILFCSSHLAGSN